VSRPPSRCSRLLSRHEAAVEVFKATLKVAVEVSRPLSKCQGCCGVSMLPSRWRPLSRCRGCCRGVEAAVEVFQAAVKVSRLLSKCRGRRRGVQGRCQSVEVSSVKLLRLGSCAFCRRFSSAAC
jgi:hypothetical protein